MTEFIVSISPLIVAGVVMLALGSIGRLLFWSGKVDRSLSSLQDGINRIDQTIARLDDTIKDLCLRIPTNQPIQVGVSSETASSNSPLTLSVKGAKWAKALKAESVAERLAKSISLPPDVSEFRIQEACHRSIFSTWRGLFNDEEIRKIEEHVYQDGGNLADTLIIYAIVTRNHILKERGFDVPEYETEAAEGKE